MDLNRRDNYCFADQNRKGHKLPLRENNYDNNSNNNVNNHKALNVSRGGVVRYIKPGILSSLYWCRSHFFVQPHEHMRQLFAFSAWEKHNKGAINGCRHNTHVLVRVSGMHRADGTAHGNIVTVWLLLYLRAPCNLAQFPKLEERNHYRAYS